jgi:circadian clock protein KaiC
VNQTFVSTGINGLDTLLDHKGLPAGNFVLISGGPGSGKTTFAIQYLVHGAVEHDQPGLYISLDEDPQDIKKNMHNFGWDLAQLEDDIRFMFINVSPLRSGAAERSGLMQLGMKEFKLVRLLEAIKDGVKEIQAKRVVIDPVTMFMLQYPDEEERTHAMRDLIAELKETECTHLLVSELRGTGLEREYQFEEYLTQGVILLRTHQKDGKVVRILQVEKMRGVNIDPQPRPYDITAEGIVVFPDLPVFN